MVRHVLCWVRGRSIHHFTEACMRSKLVLSALAVSLLALPAGLAAQTSAQLQQNGVTSLGVVGAFNVPVGDLGDITDPGWGVYAQGTAGKGILTLVAEGGYDKLSAKDFEIGGEPVTGESLDAWHAALGARFTLGPIYAGGLAGYWFNDVDEFDVVPMIGLHVWKLDIGARYKGLFGDFDWIGITAGIHFGKW